MTDIDLRALSAPIIALRDDVQEAYKRLEDKWNAIAEQLNKLHFPCTVGYAYDYDLRSDDEDRCRLEYRKHKGAKRICIVVYSTHQTPNGDYQAAEITPYEEWSAEQRLEMLRHVPKLFEEAVKETQRFIDQTKE